MVAPEARGSLAYPAHLQAAAAGDAVTATVRRDRALIDNEKVEGTRDGSLNCSLRQPQRKSPTRRQVHIRNTSSASFSPAQTESCLFSSLFAPRILKIGKRRPPHANLRPLILRQLLDADRRQDGRVVHRRADAGDPAQPPGCAVKGHSQRCRGRCGSHPQ